MGRAFLLLIALLTPGEAAIKHIDLIHLSHTDFGFTDHPAVCREMQVRYLDIALDAAREPGARPGAPGRLLADDGERVRVHARACRMNSRNRTHPSYACWRAPESCSPG